MILAPGAKPMGEGEDLSREAIQRRDRSAKSIASLRFTRGGMVTMKDLPSREGRMINRRARMLRRNARVT